MVMQAGLGLRRDEIVSYIKSVLPIVIQQTKVGGWRGTSTVHFSRMAEWRQERAGGKARHGARRRL
jgi:type IV secretion system protein VirB11